MGIIAFSFYAYFRGRVQRLTADLEAAATEILAVFSLYYSPASASGTRRREREAAALDDDF